MISTEGDCTCGAGPVHLPGCTPIEKGMVCDCPGPVHHLGCIPRKALSKEYRDRLRTVHILQCMREDIQRTGMRVPVPQSDERGGW